MWKVFIKLFFMLSALKRTTSYTINNITKIEPWSYTDSSILYEIDIDIKFKTIIPINCLEIGICEHVPGLPDKEITRLIDIMIADKVNFNMDKEIIGYHGNKENSVELCRSKPTRFRPQAAKDVNDQWYLVVNSKFNNVQSFNGEACLGNPHDSCSNVATFQRNYRGECIQKYINRPMIVLSRDFKKIIVKMLLVPTCCSCVAFSIDK